MELSSITNSAIIPFDHPLFIGISLFGMAVVPMMLMAVTSFVKLNVVFTILRNAIGAGQVPSGAIATLLALVMTGYIMAPTAFDVKERIANVGKEAIITNKKEGTGIKIEAVPIIVTEAIRPIEKFLRKHSRIKERLFFASQIKQINPITKNQDVVLCDNDKIKEEANFEPSCRINKETIISLIPAFVVSELRDAFFIGFIIFLPFLVIDLVVTNVLVALGMMMVSPPTISLPLKILVFVLSDGWYLLCKNLVLNYL